MIILLLLLKNVFKGYNTHQNDFNHEKEGFCRVFYSKNTIWTLIKIFNKYKIKFNVLLHLKTRKSV